MLYNKYKSSLTKKASQQREKIKIALITIFLVNSALKFGLFPLCVCLLPSSDEK